MVCAAALVIALQAGLAMDTFGERFLNTAYHYFFDNAFFTTAARHANVLGLPASRCGVVAPVAHAAWNEPSAPPIFYSHHPYGAKALMQFVMRFTGHGESASRGFGLAVSICAAIGMLLTLAMLSGDVFSGMIGAATFVSLPVMAIYQTCIKFEIDGMAASAWIFPAILLFLEHPNILRRSLLVAVGIVAALSAWTGVMFAGIVAASLVVAGAVGRKHSERPNYRSAGLLLASGVAAGLLLLIGLFAWQKGGMLAFAADLGGAFKVHAERAGFTNAEWLARQQHYNVGNFGYGGLALLGCGIGLIVHGAVRGVDEAAGLWSRARHPLLLWVFLGASMATAMLWVGVFREGCYVHEYWSMVACMPIAATATILVAASPARFRMASRCASALVVGAMYLAAWQALAGRLQAMREEGTLPDVEFVITFRDEPFQRFVYVPLGRHPFDFWFHPRLFEFYTDRTIVPVAAAGPVGRGDKVILLAYDEQAAAEKFVESRLRITLTNRRTGPRFCVYDALPAEATGGAQSAPQ